MSDALEARLTEIRAALEACEAEGFDPAQVTISSHHAGDLGVFPDSNTETARALAVFARLCDEEPERSDQSTATVYLGWDGNLKVFAEVNPDSPYRTQS